MRERTRAARLFPLVAILALLGSIVFLLLQDDRPAANDPINPIVPQTPVAIAGAGEIPHEAVTPKSDAAPSLPPVPETPSAHTALATGSLRGRVTLEGNFATPKIRVVVHGFESTDGKTPRSTRQTETDEGGYYSFDSLPPGKTTIFVQPVMNPGLSVATREIEMSPGAALQEDFQLSMGRVRGVLAGASADSMRHASIRILDPEQAHGGARPRSRGEIRPESTGAFQSDWIPTGEWRILIETRDGLGAERTIQLGVGETDLGEIRLETPKPKQARDER